MYSVNNLLLNPDDQVDEINDDAENDVELTDFNFTSEKWTTYQNIEREIDIEEKQDKETKVIHEEVSIVETVKLTHQNCKNSFDVCFDKNGPYVLIDTPLYRELYTNLEKNWVKIRFMMDITEGNLKYCKQITELFRGEVKHLEGLKGNFVILDKRLYLATSMLEKSKPVPELIYSNVESIVEQNLYVFENLWKRAIPAEKRIREIEKGLLPVETKVLETTEEILTQITNLVEKTEIGVSICSPIGGLQLLENMKPLLESYKSLIKRHKEGKVKDGIRWVTFIGNNKKQVALVKKFLDMGINIRHLNNIPSLTFGVSEKQFQSTIEKMKGGKMIQSVLHSTDPLYIQHYQSLFEDLWNSAIDAQEQIKYIQTGTALDITRIIEQPTEAKQLLFHILENAREEIMIIYPSSKSVDIQEKIGTLYTLVKKSQDNVKIRILSPMNVNLDQMILSIRPDVIKTTNLIVREILKRHDFKPTIVMVDRAHVLALELKDDTKEMFEEATGLSTYSTSKPTVLSYISIFESLWEQTEMSISLGIANKKLIQNEQTEREFINTAAHELRTPTQAIMGYTELDHEIFNDILNSTKLSEDKDLKRNILNLHKHFDAVYRNANRLNELINNLLDVARIESNRKNGLLLHKEILDLVKEINGSIRIQLDQKIRNKNIKINFINDSLEEQIWVYADKSRLNQIINNLIGNAIKFSNRDGKIDIMIKENFSNSNENIIGKTYNVFENIKHEIKKKKEKYSVKQEIFIGISDTGKGISTQVMPKLFEKFVTDSDSGTGLGLFITRSLVEAHDGRIWAFNNKDGIGSTFVFSLLKIDDSNLNNK